jgi:hypothetical protein
VRTLHRRALRVPAARRGVALLLAVLLLVVLLAITIQIRVATGTDARVARNDLSLASMDLVVESALLNVHEMLKTDGESTGESPGAAGQPAGANPLAGGGAPGAGAAGAGGGESQSSDSRRDEWYEPQRTTINDIQLRIHVVDEESKCNVLNLLLPDEKEAQAAFDRVVRVLDLCREGSRDFDIDPRTAEQMARAMLEHMQRRKDSKVPRPKLLTDEEKSDVGLPLSLEEFAGLEPFVDHHFKDFRDRDGHVVHSIGSFLTVWSSPGLAADLPGAGGRAGPPTAAAASGAAGSGGGTGATTGGGSSTSGKSGGTAGTSGGTQGTGGTGSTSGGQPGTGQGGTTDGTTGGTGTGGTSGGTIGGYGVNVNTAPAAVLKALFDDRDLHPRFFDKVIEYRNLEEEEDESQDSSRDETAKAEEPELDEYGQEKIVRRIFDSLGELSEVEGYKDLPSEQQTRLNQLLTTQSNVFTIYVVARKSTSVQGDMDSSLSPEELRRKEETSGDSLVRVVRSVVWRHTVDEEIVLTPLVRFEVLDYVPFEVLDFPPEDR